MKIFVLCLCVSTQFLIGNSKVIPEYLPQFCSQSDPSFNECFTQVLNKLGPYLLKGVREINFPKLNPLHIPLFVVNRTLNENVNIFLVTKDTKIWGFNRTSLESFKFDPQTKNGELHLRIPNLKMTTEYEVKGQLLTTILESAGFFKGNFTDIELYFKFSLKPVERLGVKYYAFDDFKARSTYGNGHINLASKNPNLQFTTDLLTNFFNEDPKRTIDAVQPIYEESVEIFYRKLAEEVLSAIPADELIPA